MGKVVAVQNEDPDSDKKLDIGVRACNPSARRDRKIPGLLASFSPAKCREAPGSIEEGTIEEDTEGHSRESESVCSAHMHTPYTPNE